MPKANPDPLEKVIEQKVCDHAKKRGCLVYKFTSPARRSVPDRLFIMPAAKGVFFIEFKRKGHKPTPAQEVEITKIRAQGVPVFVADSVESGVRAVEQAWQSSDNHTPAPQQTFHPACVTPVPHVCCVDGELTDLSGF